MLNKSFPHVLTVPYQGLTFHLLCFLWILFEDMLVEKALFQSEATDGFGSRGHVHKLASLVAADVVIANEGPFVNEDSHLKAGGLIFNHAARGCLSPLGHPLLIGIVSNPYNSLLYKVHLMHFLLFIID